MSKSKTPMTAQERAAEMFGPERLANWIRPALGLGLVIIGSLSLLAVMRRG
jgi:hypothetical protein